MTCVSCREGVCVWVVGGVGGGVRWWGGGEG